MSRERESQPYQPPTQVLYALLLFAGVMLALAIFFGYRFEKASVTENNQALKLLLWAAFNAIVGGFAAFWAWFYRPTEDLGAPPVPPAKLLILSVGGTLGLTTLVFLGLLWPLFNEDWLNLVEKGGRAAWKDWHAWFPILAGLAGLIVTFLSLLAVKSEERSHPALRRMIYGYNAFLTGFLLLAIVAVLMVMVHFYGNPTFDWTASHIYTISDETKRILRDLQTPVKLYVIFPAGNQTRSDLEMMLSSFKAINPKMIDYQSISPTSLTELPLIAQLQSQYGWTMEDSSERDGVAKGVLVVADKEGDKSVSDFVKKNTMEEIKNENPMGGGDEDSGRVFKGEQAVMTAVVNLTGGKTNQTIYFTQGSGEPKLDDFNVAVAQNRGLAALKRRLEDKGYVIKELTLLAEQGSTPKVPDDAFAVVVAAPQNMEESKVEALREYAKTSKGKLVILVDVNRNKEWKLTPTGLEKFLAEFGVQINNEIVLNAYSQQGLVGAHAIVATQGDRAFADVFRQQDPFLLFEARSVRPAANNPSSKYVVTPLLEAYKPKDRPLGQWTEEKPGDILTASREDLIQYVKNKIKENETTNAMPFPLAVTIREKGDQPQDANNPHAFMNPDAQGTPKMVVFGDATMVSNWGLSEAGPDLYFDLFNGSLAWLRGRSDLMKEIPAKIRSSYRMTLTDDQNRVMQYYPGALMLFAIVAMGLFVFVMRRR